MNGQVFAGTVDGTCVLKLVGSLRCLEPDSIAQSEAMNAFLDQCFASGEFHHFLVDLSETEAIDSTNLGVIARIAQHTRAHDLPKASIVTTRPEITRLLSTMGFDYVFIIIDHPVRVPKSIEELPSVGPTDIEIARLVLRAHEALSALNEHNRTAYKLVVDLLRKELGESQST